jgi:hypothetical protein
MSRDDGFAIADVDTSFFADPKVVALARRLRDPVQTAAHLALYQALVLGSWGAGVRITFDEAVPAWWLESPDAIRSNLAAVGLIDADGRIPRRAWTSWYLPAYTRREARRESGRLGGTTSGTKRRKMPGEPSVEQRPTHAQPTLNPSVQSAPSVPSVPAGQQPTEAPRPREETGLDHGAPAAVEPLKEGRPERPNGANPAPKLLRDVMHGMGLPVLGDPPENSEPPA